MILKRLVVLANSIKRNARCVAGIELRSQSRPALTAWIRPVSGESQGELEPRHMTVEGGLPVTLLDVIDIPLGRCVDDAIHPEDWVVDTSSNWKPAGRLHPIALDGLAEAPDNLWLQSKSRTERATRDFLLQRSNHQSLHLISPQDFRIELSCKHNLFKNKDQKKTKAKFTYRDQEYQMSLTDPVFTERYCTHFPAVGAKPLVARAPFGDNCLVCVSLTPEFNGYHYKVVAAVLELQ